MPLGGTADQMRFVDIPTCFVYHGLNAHREGDDIVLYVHRLDEAFGKRGDLVDAFLTEWRIGTAGPQLTFSEKRLFDRPLDLPTHDRRLTGRKSRHGWCATTVPPDSEYGFELAGVCHVDLQTGEEDNWDPGKDLRAGEGFFVPSDPSADGAGHEGEGWVFTYIWDRTTDRSSLGIFDAMDVAAGPVAEVKLPFRVPFGFHGYWVDESLL
jgi:carotenoid cleavage dioxygenase